MRWANKTPIGKGVFYATCEDAGTTLYVILWEKRFCVSPRIGKCYTAMKASDIATSMMAAKGNCPKMTHWKIKYTEDGFATDEVRYEWKGK